MPAPANASIARVRVGGREYDAVSERTCRTCGSEYRAEVERQAIAGRTWARIVDSLPANANLTARNIADHWRNGHVPVSEPTVAALLEQQATERGDVTQAAVEQVLSHLDFARVLIGQVRRRVLTGELKPDVRDAIRAMELLARYEPDPVLDESAIVTAFIEYHETAAEIMSVEQFAEFGRRLDENQTLNELAKRWDAAHS